MWFLMLLSWLATSLHISFCVLSLATGLYYLAELVEEYTVITCKLIYYLIISTLTIYIGLLIFESFPISLVLCGIASQVFYLLLLRNFPYFNIYSPSFISSVSFLIVNHYLAFSYFSLVYYPFNYIIGYFTLCQWLIPFAFFISLNANDNVLPTHLDINKPIQSDPLRSTGQTRQLKNRLGTVIVSVLLILVLLILLLTIYLFKKRILLLAMNENKISEANLNRNMHLLSTNNTNNLNSINTVNPELGVDATSNSENDSSQPSSKTSIQRLFKRNVNTQSNNDRPTKFFRFNKFMNKMCNLEGSVPNRLSNYMNCFGKAEQQTTSTNVNNQFLHSQLNPIFIDQLECQDTSIKECIFRQYDSSTLKPNQISLVRLQNQQRAARLIKASNYHFNQFCQFNHPDQINHFVRQQSVTSSMKSDSLLISARRRLVRDQLIRSIKQNERTVHLQCPVFNSSPKQLLNEENDTRQEAGQNFVSHNHECDEKDAKQFYYFAQHCLTLPQNLQSNRIESLIQKARLEDTSDKSSDILNISDSSSSDKSSSYDSKNSKDSTNSEFINKIDLDRKPKLNNDNH